MSRTALLRTRPLRPLSLLTALAALCALALLPGTAARAGAYTYSAGAGSQRTVNAGVLLLDGVISGNANTAPTVAQGADDKDPYVFYILNQRIDVKPFGWNIVNPLAQTAVTSTEFQRWQNRTTSGPTYQLGQTLTPAMAAYWEVPLATTVSTDLSKFDVLFLNLEQPPAFTAAESEKLRRFVEGGGTLWIENSGTAVATSVNGLFFNLRYNNAGTGAAYVPTFIRPSLITVPYQLSEAELNTLGDKHIGGYYADNGIGAVPQDNSGRLFFSTIVGNSGNSDLPVIAASSYGAGEIVITTTGSANAINEYAGGVNVGVGGNSGPFCGIGTQLAPTADLKLVADIIASTGSHYNEHQNSHQSGNDIDSLPSAVQTWHFPNGGPAATGAVISGHIAYAVVAGNLTAWDLYPAEDLDGDGNPDDGKITDFNTGKPYDELWEVQVGDHASAPTVATDTYQIKNAAGQTVTVTGPAVFVAKNDGTVLEVQGNTVGTSIYTYSDHASATPYSTQPAPAPSVFDGRLYVGRADGTLYVAPLQNAGTVHNVDPNIPSGTQGNPVLAAPTVGIIPGDSTGRVPTNDIVALCVTQQGLFSTFLGSRGELLSPVGGTGSYNTKLLTLPGTMMDIAGVQRSYTLSNPDSEAVTSTATANPSTPFFSGGPTTGQLYADYDVDFANTPGTVNLTRTYVGASALAVVSPGGGGAYTSIVSTPALDRLGNVYYTVTDANGSSLVSVHDGPNQNRVHMNWRFLLPTQGVNPGNDADGANYDALQGFKFTTTANGLTMPSAPVVDAQGNVYVLASQPGPGTSSGPAAILSFNTNASVSADAVAIPGQAGGITSVSITQPLLSDTSSEFPGQAPTPIPPNQYTLSAAGGIIFTDFAQRSGGAGGVASVYPNLNEPYPITVGFTTGGVATTQNQNVRPLHTNLSWYTVFDGKTAAGAANPRQSISASSGVTLVGGTLYFVNSSGFLTSVPADPVGSGFTVTNKFADSAVAAGAPSLATTIDDTQVGPTTAVPSAGNGAMLINGPNGLTAYSNQVTLVVDANRVLEMNASGDAEWAVDSTSKTTLAGATAPVAGGPTGTGQYVTTTLELNRPTSLTELTANDYLIADTGNNRCVRFDRGGKVLWELTNFTDPFSKLTPGEPATLNQPTSVQIRSETGKDASGNLETIVRYLISDTGNDRIVEVDDVFDQYFHYETEPKTGQPEYHVLNWISHTHDVQGRDYRYQSAAYYASPISGKYYIVALVTNKRIAPFTYTLQGTQTYGQVAPSFLAPANKDVAGGTIVLLDYDPANYYGTAGFGTNNQADGFIGTDPTSHNLIAVSTIRSSIFPAGAANAGRFDPTGGSGLSTLYIRNPRYLKVVTKLQVPKGGGAAVSARHYLLADDNGVWDLDGVSFTAQFGFTQADYRSVSTPISQDGVNLTTFQTKTTQVSFDRTKIPFLPTAIQLTGSDLVTTGVGSATYGRYLITNSYSQGEAVNKTGDFGSAYNTPTTTLPTADPIPGFGGEVFEVHYVGTSGTYVETHDTLGGTPEYTGHTISRPTGTNTSPLSQPAFAYRLQF